MPVWHQAWRNRQEHPHRGRLGNGRLVDLLRWEVVWARGWVGEVAWCVSFVLSRVKTLKRGSSFVVGILGRLGTL